MTNVKYWWQEEPESTIVDVVALINDSTYRSSPIDRVRLCFDALNKLWNRFYIYRESNNGLTESEKENGRRDITSFQQLLLQGLIEDERRELCKNEYCATIADLNPKVMNHDTLLKLSYNPSHITEDQRQKAQRMHKELEDEYQRFRQGSRSATKLIKKLARFLYMIRSNIAHGEKTPRGPDLDKVKRDEDVCKATFPILNVIIDLLLDKPSGKLSIYGTLAPGGVNNPLLENIDGEWKNGRLRGKITIKNGLPYFEWDLSQQEIEVWVFKSPRLCQKFSELDAFEGKSYKRIVVPVQIGSYHEITNIYAKNHDAGFT